MSVNYKKGTHDVSFTIMDDLNLHFTEIDAMGCIFCSPRIVFGAHIVIAY